MMRLAIVSLGGVQKLKSEVVHARAELAQMMEKDIVKDDCRNRRKQARCGGNERLGDPRGDGPHRGRSGSAEAVEGVDDSPYRPEESDERCYRSGGSEPREHALHRGQLLAGGDLQRSLDSDGIGDAAFGVGELMAQLLIAGVANAG